MKGRFIKPVLAVMILLLVVVVSRAAQAQELTKIYGRFLPKDYIYDAEKREQMELLLQAKSRISPDLIYYYITYYNMLSSGSTAAEKAGSNSFKNIINGIEKSFLKERNLWAEEQISQLRKAEAVPEIKTRLEEKFKKLLVDLPADPGPVQKIINEDENLKNFYAVLYLNPDLKAMYSKEINYAELRIKEEGRIREKIFMLNSSRQDDENKAGMISYLLDRWYILDSAGEAADSKKSEIKPYELIMNLDKTVYSVKRQSSFSFGIGFSPYNNACSIKPVLPVNGYNGSFDFEMIRPMQQIGVSLGYKYYMRDVVGLLSYINAQLIYFYSFPIDAENESPGFVKHYTVETINYTDNLAFSRSLLSPRSGQSLFLNLTVPVYMMLNSINVEVGLLAGLNSVKYNFDYDYRYTQNVSYTTGSMWDPKQVNYTILKGTGKKNYEATETRTIFSPVIGININPSLHTNAELKLSTQFISLFMMYGF